jgi:O-antigen ligase
MTNFVTRLTRNHILNRPEIWVLAGIASLAAFTPFGAEATHPAVFLAYRGVLMATMVLAFWAIGGGSSPDLPIRCYLVGALALLLMLFSVWASPGNNPAGTVIWYEHLLFALLFIALARFSARQSKRWKQAALGVLVLVTLIHFALGLSSQDRFDNVFGNANHLAAYLLVGFGAALAAAFFGTAIKWRVLGVAASLVLFYGITATLSRGATLAAIGVIGLAVLKIERRKVFVLIGVAAFAIAIGVTLANPVLIERFTDRGEIDPYNYQRLEIWKSTLSMVQEYPLLGVGLSRYDDVARRFRPPVEGTISRYMKRQDIAHSEYLQYSAETGIPAGALILLLLVLTLRLLWHGKSAVQTANYSLVNERAGLLAASGVLAHGLVDNVFTVRVLVSVIGVVALASGPLTASRRQWLSSTRAGQIVLALGVLLLFLSSSVVPAAAYALNRSGQAYLAEGDIRNAERTQRLALTVRSDDAQLMINLGRVYREEFDRFGDLNLLDRAEAYFDAAAESNPDLLQARMDYVDSLLARFTGDDAADRARHGRFAQANEAILALDPFLPIVGLNLATAYYQSGQRDSAYDQLHRTIELEPNFVPGYLTLAQWYQADGNESDSQAMLETGAGIIERYLLVENLTDYESFLLGRR